MLCKVCALPQVSRVDVLVTHEAPFMPGSDLPDEYGRMPSPEQQESAERDRTLVSQTFVGTQPQFLVHGHWHQRHTWVSADGEMRVEGLGRDGDRMGAMVVWDSETGTLEGIEVQWGRRKN